MTLKTCFLAAFLAGVLPTALAATRTQGSPIYPKGSSSKCLGVVGGNFYNGAEVDIYDCLARDNQQWFMHNGLTQVQTASDKYCVDAGLPPFDNNRVLTVWECNKDLPQQQWYWSDDYGTIALNGQRKCMDLTNGSMDNQNRIQLYDCWDGNTNQLWSHDDPMGAYSSWNSSSTTTSSSNVAGNAVLSGALEGSSDSSGSSDGFAKWAPIVVGLLAANLAITLALAIAGIINIRKGKGVSYRSLTLPSSREQDTQSFMEKPSFRD